MKILIKLIRNLLGGLIAGIDYLTRGRKLKRDEQDQTEVNQAAKQLTLYQFFACPFCIKTRRAIYKLNLPIAKRSVSEGSLYRQELQQYGGKIQAPCLRIEKDGKYEWLYESSAIIDYLKSNFAK